MKTYEQLHEDYKAELYEELSDTIRHFCARNGIDVDSEQGMLEKLNRLSFEAPG